MSFRKFDGSNHGRGETLHPRVTIWSSGKIAFNSVAVRRWLDDAEHVEVFTHETEPKFAVVPVDEETGHSYILHEKGNYNGKLLHGKALLKELYCARPGESMVADAEYDMDAERVVVDVSMLYDR